MYDNEDITLTPDASAEHPVIEVDHVSMVFNMASERIQSLKEYFIKIIKRELMFKEFVALDDVSLTVNQGDVFGLVGSNGSGKSTLLKIIAGVLEPSKGTCKVEGSIAPLIELGAGFDMELSARENIYLNGALLGYSRQFINDHFDSIVDFAEIRDFLDMPMKNYSSGMVARIAFAIATETIPDVLIVDEVLSVGDYMFQEKCEKRINALITDHHVTVLIVSHDGQLIERLCNKAAWIEKGHLRLLGDAATVCDAYKALGWHLGSEESERRVFQLLAAEPQESKTCKHMAYGSGDPAVTSLELLKAKEPDALLDRVVIAPADEPATCMVANSLCSRTDADLLLASEKRMPDELLELMERASWKEAIILGSDASFRKSIRSLIADASPCTELSEIDGDDPGMLSVNAHFFAEREPCDAAHDKVIIAYPECVPDMLLVMPFSYERKVPLFLATPNEPLQEDVLEAIRSCHPEEMLLLGGEDVFPEEMVRPLHEEPATLTRVCGNGVVDAAGIIYSWMDDNAFDVGGEREVFFASPWHADQALGIGPLLHQRGALMALQDSRDLDNVMGNVELLKRYEVRPVAFTFFGTNEQFHDADKRILRRAFRDEG